MQDALSNSLAQIGVRRSPQLQAFAQHVTTLANLATSKSPTAATAIGLASIDATLGALGPVYLTNPSTLGSGTINVNVIGGSTHLDALDGESLAPAPEPGLLLLDDRQGEPLAVAVAYRLGLRQSATGIAVTYGVTDTWNASLLLPFVNSNLSVRAKAGGLSGQLTMHHFGVGDLTARLKHRLPDLWDIHSAVSLDAQFPTGDPADLSGTGDYWLSPTLAASTLLFDGWMDITANAGMDFDLQHSTQTQALYGLGASVALLPWPGSASWRPQPLTGFTVAGIVEFLGRSQLDAIATPKDTDVFYLTPTGIVHSPLFGFTFDRADYLDLAFGVRITIPPIAIILGGVYHLDDAGLHDSLISPTLGIGATW